MLLKMLCLFRILHQHPASNSRAGFKGWVSLVVSLLFDNAHSIPL